MRHRFITTASSCLKFKAIKAGHFTAPFADTCERYENGGITTNKIPNFFKTPLTYEISELFQIKAHIIDQIEAVAITVPYKMTADVWDE